MQNKLIKGIKNPRLIFMYFLGFKICRIIPDSIYLKIEYKLRMRKKLNLLNPKTFNEKLQWLKLYDRKHEYTNMVDKYEVRKYISEKIGEEYLIPLLGVWDKFEDIDFEQLPNQFVLKPNHTSGNIYICKDKSKINYKGLEKEVNSWLKREYYWGHREWPYKNIKPRIICEKLLENEIKDYKFYCFSGEPKFLYVSQGLVSDHSLLVDFFDLKWNKMPFRRMDYLPFEKNPQKPSKFNDMIDICKILCKEKFFIRVDLFEVDKRVYFSELTLYPASGYMPIEPINYDNILGTFIKLPINEK